jgi:hypothetical protein
MGGGSDTVDIESLELPGPIENRAELAGEQVDLVVGQLQQRELSHLHHLLPAELSDSGGFVVSHPAQAKR